MQATETMATGPQPGDVLIDRLPKDGHAVGLVAKPLQIRFSTYRDAVARAQTFARHTGVDVWIAEDQNRFTLIARHRTGTSPAAR